MVIRAVAVTAELIHPSNVVFIGTGLTIQNGIYFGGKGRDKSHEVAQGVAVSVLALPPQHHAGKRLRACPSLGSHRHYPTGGFPNHLSRHPSPRRLNAPPFGLVPH